MRVCPSCGQENADDVDFCSSCGQYVRWEPTRLAASVKPAEQGAVAAAQAPPAPPAAPPDGDGAGVAAPGAPAAGPPAPATPPPAAPVQNAAPPQAPTAPPPAAAAPPPPAAPPPEAPPAPPPAAPKIDPDSVLLALRLPDVESAPGEPVVAQVEAGGQSSVLVLVRNQSGIVDNYDLAVHGIPEHWWTANPGTVYLVPFGTSEQGFEQEVQIMIHPPRAPEAEARPWPMAVTAASRAYDGVQVAQADATLEVAPYQEIESELRPERKGGRRKARFAIAVRNKANAPVNVEVTGVDAGNQTRIEFEHPRFPTKPGRRAGTIFWLKPFKQIIIGRKVEHRFTVETKAMGYDVAALPKMGVFVQKPWLPWWLLILLPLLIIAAIALYLLWPRTVTVPDVRICDDVACAQRLLDSKDLKMGEQTEVKTSLREAGSPIGSSPGTGKKVKKGTIVDLRIAVATGPPKIEVPDVVGMTLADADAALKKVKLQRGALQPQPETATAKVSEQVPAAGDLAVEGSTVDLFFAKPADPDKKPADEEGTGTAPKPGGGGGGTGGGGGEGTGTGGGGVASDLAKLTIVFDNGKDILIIPARTGKPLRPLVKSDELEQEPAVSPDRDKPLVAYAKGPSEDKMQIWIVDPAEPQFAHALTNPGFSDGRPAFSPDGKVIAFRRETTAADGTRDADLCFVSVSASAAKPSCVVDPAVSVSRPTWAPAGNAILVVAQDTKDTQVELSLYTSARANSGRARDWNDQGFVTEKMHGKREGDSVRSAAWSPTGTQIAFTNNWKSNAYHLATVEVAEVTIDEKSVKQFVRQRGCELSWRPDGLELVLVQRDNLCVQPGILVRFDPKKATETETLTKLGLGAQSPVWSFLSLPKS